MSIEKGDSIPSFELNDQNSNIFNSDDIIGKKPVVIYFYPKDFTPGCTKEACSFRDSYEDFKEIGAEVIGISNDSEKSHAKFSAKYNLPFILLSDANGRVRKKFGIKKSLLGLVPGRETFVIDAQGKLIFKFNSLDASQHMKKALKAIKKMN
ncbi:peroxiredoxin [Psychroflexus gondwanensis]|jgi:peroxiredoxin Q/BCP|uniref:thioredoxin-dependent peroxiredoxin n=1 Tax=Psychroflexus gondwanensis ACAM 44 TaxID=1189619 RepID=N1WT27_9FLAO|nr:peroxiredoxin [Psychroflexus gondwanensis]EMY82170.1 peroxiredoxin [Psychroflexus gondwanensis ACAM 44]TXE20084.1 peroxiredoxin [Psychroflexus gondwanensis]